jgi:hypothetical protein
VVQYISVRNFERFQHYKERRPPWIKFYSSTLEDYDFFRLSDVAKAHLMLIWLLAARYENKIPYDLPFITQAIGATSPVDLEELILRGFLEPYEEGRAKGKYEEWPSRYIPDKLRAEVLAEAAQKCRACGSKDRLEIDHIRPISKGGTGTKGNLQVLCVKCNRIKRNRITKGEESVEATQLRSKSLRRKKNVRSPETETETKTTPAGGWVGRFGLTWESHSGGIAPFGEIGRALKPLVDRDGEDATHSKWEVFCQTEKRQFGPSWFAKHAGDFDAKPKLIGVGRDPSPEELRAAGIYLS